MLEKILSMANHPVFTVRVYQLAIAIAVTLILLALAATGPEEAEAQELVDSGGDPYYTVNPYLGLPLQPFDARVSPYSPEGALNPTSTGGGAVYAADGTYLGRLNANQYDPLSVANPYGPYGSIHSPVSTTNPYGAYGSSYAPLSAQNRYTTTPPRVRYDP